MFHLFSMEKCQEFSQHVLAQSADVFERLQRVTTHERRKIVYSFYFCELILNFET